MFEHRMRLFYLLIPLLLLGCASQKGSVRVDAGKEEGSGMPAIAAMPDDSAVIAIRKLEADPTADDGTALRKRLFNWLLASPNLHDFDASTAPIDELESSSHRYKDELMMQFLFGGAAWRLAAGEKWNDLAAQQEAGLRSMIAAYRNMVQLDPSLRDRFLDHLDELRRLGELRRYVEQANGRSER